MSSHAGERVLSDSGSTTGLATTVLALISAGTLAGISLVGAQQLLPSTADRGRPASDRAGVSAPATVDVTPRSPATASAKPAGQRPAKAAKRDSADPAGLPVLLPTIDRSPDVIDTVTTRKPTVTVPPVPVVKVPTPTVPSVPPVPSVPTVPPSTGGGSAGRPSTPSPAPTEAKRLDAYTPRATIPGPVVLGTKNGQSVSASRSVTSSSESKGGYDADRARQGRSAANDRLGAGQDCVGSPRDAQSRSGSGKGSPSSRESSGRRGDRPGGNQDRASRNDAGQPTTSRVSQDRTAQSHGEQGRSGRGGDRQHDRPGR
jgi:hypothetical protein